jgi:hypothetical protein
MIALPRTMYGSMWMVVLSLARAPVAVVRCSP